MKVTVKKDVVSIDSSGIGIQYHKDEVLDAYIIEDDFLVKENDGSSSLIGVRREAASSFNMKTGENEWDDWFNEHFEITE